MNKNIVFIGFMGSGKTSVGKRMSINLKREFIDMDDFIEKREGMTVTEIFEKRGEAAFREMERELCQRFAVPKGKIIATGGGVIKDPENVENLKKGGVIIYLRSTPGKIAYNLRFDNTRPLLAGDNKEEKIAKLMAEREGLYKSCADITIDVSDMNLDSTLREICRILKL